jgi:hypothetical protein
VAQWNPSEWLVRQKGRHLLLAPPILHVASRSPEHGRVVMGGARHLACRPHIHHIRRPNAPLPKGGSIETGAPKPCAHPLDGRPTTL